MITKKSADMTTPVTSPRDAADALAAHGEVDYQPGDGTRYDCVVVQQVRQHGGGPWTVAADNRWLIVRNLNIMLDLGKEISLMRFCLTPGTTGTWPALRPLLCCLGVCTVRPSRWALGDALNTYCPGDRHAEADMRITHDAGPLNSRDARLGSKVRRLVQGEAI